MVVKISKKSERLLEAITDILPIRASKVAIIETALNNLLEQMKSEKGETHEESCR